MAKSIKKSKDASADENSAPESLDEARNGNEPAVAPKSADAKVSRKRSTATGKSSPGEKRRKPATKKKAAPAEVAISDDEIRLRAYFIAEQRMRDRVAGDSENDWLEARRQLLQEAAGRA
jgi:hypothetical protein